MRWFMNAINEKKNCVRHEMTSALKNKLCMTTCVRHEMIYECKDKLCKHMRWLMHAKKIV